MGKESEDLNNAGTIPLPAHSCSYLSGSDTISGQVSGVLDVRTCLLLAMELPSLKKQTTYLICRMRKPTQLNTAKLGRAHVGTYLMIKVLKNMAPECVSSGSRPVVSSAFIVKSVLQKYPNNLAIVYCSLRRNGIPNSSRCCVEAAALTMELQQ